MTDLHSSQLSASVSCAAMPRGALLAELGHCYWGYTCKYCDDYYTIDSGD